MEYFKCLNEFVKKLFCPEPLLVARTFKSVARILTLEIVRALSQVISFTSCKKRAFNSKIGSFGLLIAESLVKKALYLIVFKTHLCLVGITCSGFERKTEFFNVS